MSSPKFKWIGFKERGEGLAVWQMVEGCDVTQEFDSFAEANKIANMVQRAYTDGKKEGQEHVACEIRHKLKGLGI